MSDQHCSGFASAMTLPAAPPQDSFPPSASRKFRLQDPRASNVRQADDRVFKHGNSLFGDLKYPPDFKHFDYVNPDAPKGGRLRLGVVGSFDSFNPYIIKGDPAAGLGYLYETAHHVELR